MKYLKWLLFPFMLLYIAITALRNYLFEIGYKSEFNFECPVIAVGNLTVGGTGKTPMIEYLINVFNQEFDITTLSRGYGRKTKGYRLATADDNAQTLGDEPYQYFKKFQNINVAVGEERAMAIPYILTETNTNLILLDDAYQHRYVKPDANILLSDFNRPFYTDHVLPVGLLRESRRGAKRADAIIVTKCPADLTGQQQDEIKGRISKYSTAPVYFTTIRYDKINILSNHLKDDFSKALVVTGIAQSSYFIDYVKTQFDKVEVLTFPDHHDYSVKDLDKIEERLSQLGESGTCIATTEKDLVKLQSEALKDRVSNWPLCYYPITPEFLQNATEFKTQILNLISNKANSN